MLPAAKLCKTSLTQVRPENVGPALDPNCLTDTQDLIEFKKDLLEKKKSTDINTAYIKTCLKQSLRRPKIGFQNQLFG